MKYFQEKIRIDKARNYGAAYKIQRYFDNMVDDYVVNHEDNVVNRPTNAMIYAELSILNKPEVYANYNRIINSKYTNNDNLFKFLMKNKANKDLERIVEAELERAVKNLDYVEQVFAKYDIPVKEYEKRIIAQKEKSLGGRQKILNDIVKQQNKLGLDINYNVFSYRDIEKTAESLLRQSQMNAGHERINAINENAKDQGKEPPYKRKEWIWTGLGQTTRHASNHLQKRRINEPFIIVNDATMEIDELMYPSDPNGSPSNTYICYCEVEYLTD